MIELVLSLGSNIEPKKKYLSDTIGELAGYFKIIKVSSVYKTEPLYDTEQDSFFNICVLSETDIRDPYKVLSIIQNIEKKIGRVRDIVRPKGPRIIDIDIIFFDEIDIKEEKLVIPHKSAFERKFVLKPLIEILPKASIYYKKYRLKNMIKSLKEQKIRKIGVLNT